MKDVLHLVDIEGARRYCARRKLAGLHDTTESPKPFQFTTGNLLPVKFTSTNLQNVHL